MPSRRSCGGIVPPVGGVGSSRRCFELGALALGTARSSNLLSVFDRVIYNQRRFFALPSSFVLTALLLT